MNIVYRKNLERILSTAELDGNFEQLEAAILLLQAATEGTLFEYASTAEAMAVTPLPANNIPFIVRGSTNGAEDGHYIYDSNEAGGYKPKGGFEVPGLNAGTLNPTSTTTTPAEKTVADFVESKRGGEVAEGETKDVNGDKIFTAIKDSVNDGVFDSLNNIKTATQNSISNYIELYLIEKGLIDPSIMVYIMAGQSNMDGRGETGTLPTYLQGNIEGCFYWDGLDWAQLTATNTSSTGEVNPIAEFGYRQRQIEPNKNHYFIVEAEGGTSLAVNWAVGTGTNYNNLVTKINDSISNLDTSGFDYSIKAMCWMQGETDAGNEAWSLAYATNEASLFTSIKGVAGNDIKIISGNIAGSSTTLLYQNNVMAEKITNQDTSVTDVLINTSSYGLESDNLHYNISGAVELGNDMYLALNGQYIEYGLPFTMTIDTTKTGSASDTFILPTTGYGYNAKIDWGDTNEEMLLSAGGNTTHQYASSGTYQIKVYGALSTIYFNNSGDKLKLTSIDNWGDNRWRTMLRSFQGCANMDGLYTDAPNLSMATNIGSVFRDCFIFNGSMSGWNTSTLDNMGAMFYNCKLFNQSVSDFDTSNNLYFGSMFYECNIFNQSVSNFDTSKGIDFSSMFYDCDLFNKSVSNFDTSQATTLSGMFNYAATFNQSVSNFNTDKVITMSFMFNNAQAFNQSVSNFNTSLVTNMQNMFTNAFAFKQSIATFDMSLVSNVTNMLSNCDINDTGTTTNYDATLIAWELQDLVNGLTINLGTSKYSVSGQTAKNAIIADDSWTFIDGGLI